MAIQGVKMNADRRRTKRTSVDDTLHNRLGIPKSNQVQSRRLVSRAVVAILGVIALFSSYYYVPAFVPISQTLGLSGENIDKTPGSVLSFMHGRKGYFRAGQAVEVEYILPPESQVNLELKRCGGPIVFEILKCNTAETMTMTLGEKLRGHTGLYVAKSGFYYMQVTSVETPSNQDGYSVVWKRG